MQKSKRKVTVHDLLTKDDVTDVLGSLNKIRPHITDLIAIYIDRRDGKYHWMSTGETLTSTTVWMMESVKLDMLSLESEDE